MHAKTKIALATMLVILASSNAMAQSTARYNDAPRANNQEIIEDGSPLTRIAAHKPARSTHSRLRQSRNAGLRTGGYAPWSAQQAPESQFDRRGPLDFNDSDDNYQYWRQACCL
jgi:hypothetical protein